jgi:shikimate kinase
VNRQHLAFVGMAGAGKSAIARRIAAELGWPVADLDALVSASDGRPVAAIFAESGEPVFRDLESRHLAEVLAAATPSVIATGGGVVERDSNRSLLAGAARVVWLDAPQDVLVERLRNSSVRRPLLEGDLEANLRELLARREPWYRDLADVRVVVGPADIGATTASVLEAVRERWPDLRGREAS